MTAKILRFSPKDGFRRGTVVISLKNLRACRSGDLGVVMTQYPSKRQPGTIRYLVLFEGLGFDEFSSEELHTSMVPIPGPHCSMLDKYQFSSMSRLEADLRHGPLKGLFIQASRIAEEHLPQ